MPYDRSPMVLGNRVPYGRGSLEGAEPPYADGFPHGRVGPVVEGNPGEWVIVPAEAPYDGRYYVRQNRAWIATTFLDALPIDLSSIYGRKRNLVGPDTWERVVGEAPGDNRLYARENGIWVAFTSIGEAPMDATMYGRTGGIWARSCNEAPTNIMATYVYGRRDGQWFPVPMDIEDGVITGVPYARLRIGEQTLWVRVPPEAPLNTTLYGRQNGQWVPISTGGIGEAPNDNRYYARFSLTWAEVPGEIPEAAPAGKTYGRSWQLWLEVPRDVTVNTEGLVDGIYVRRKEGTTGSWVPAPTPPVDAPVDATFYARKGTPVTDPVPRWQQIPIQDDAPVNDNLYARRNNWWFECPEEAPNTGIPYLRKHHQWVPISPDPWQSVPLFFPNDWVGETYLRYRLVAGGVVEFVGNLFPATPLIAGPPTANEARNVGQLAAPYRPQSTQMTIIPAFQGVIPTRVIRTICISVAASTGMVSINRIVDDINSIEFIHFSIALYTT